MKKQCTNPSCRRAGKELPLIAFYRNHRTKDGRVAWCKECSADRQRQQRTVEGEGNKRKNELARLDRLKKPRQIKLKCVCPLCPDGKDEHMAKPSINGWDATVIEKSKKGFKPRMYCPEHNGARFYFDADEERGAIY